MSGVATVLGAAPEGSGVSGLPEHLQANLDENPWAGQGAVLLDIGGDVGALVVEMPDALIGHEVEIDPVDGRDERHAHGHTGGHTHGHRRHVAVVPRRVPAGVVASVVFGDLVQGRYRLLHPGTDDVTLEVEVVGGEVTWSAWPR